MEIAIGSAILDRIAIGSVRIYHRTEPVVSAVSVLTPEKEWTRLQYALSAAQTQLDGLYRLALDAVGGENAAIFQIHQMMLEDDDYLSAMQTVIRERNATAEYAVIVIRQEFADAFAALQDPYMRARAADVGDISQRMVRILTGAAPPSVLGNSPAILAADDLTPSELMELDRNRLLGFVTQDPSTNSHTAILARTMGIPALMGVNLDDSWNGRTAVLDGFSGRICIEPTAELLAEMTARRDAALTTV